MHHPSPAACANCPAHHAANLVKLGVDMKDFDYVVALAGNPNTGKSTVFNALTGLRQHTGNWPGKTVVRAEGGFSADGDRYKLVDLPGTYSLLSTSLDETVARDFILFGRPDVTVIVVDATRLERNLNLVLQVLEITDRVVICLNLMDEAKRRGLDVDPRRLARDLGVPVVPAAARFGDGLDDLSRAIGEVARGETVCRPHRVAGGDRKLKRLVDQLAGEVETLYPELPNARWVALRLLDGDDRIAAAIRDGSLGELQQFGDEDVTPITANPAAIEGLLDRARQLRWQVGKDFHLQLMENVYTEAARLADRSVTRSGEASRFDWDRAVDRVVTSRVFGFPIMLAMLTVVFWITIAGANVPSAMLATLLIDNVHPLLKDGAAAIGMPWWLDGLLIDGIYLATAWVVSVMLPPMAIFFPLFTLLEDFGYLPRVAFNMDHLFRRVGAHGKQSLTMAMGWGCNAAAIVSTRIIDSPRERLIAIITNNFALCNGRWPTQILIATIFIGGLVPAYLAGLDLGPGGRGRRRSRHRAHVRHLVAAVPDDPAGRGLGVPPRAAAVPAAAHPADDLHVDHRPDADRAVAGRDFRDPGRRRDLADLEHLHRRCDGGAGADERPGPVRVRDRPERDHSGRVHHRDPGERDRDPDHPHAHRAGCGPAGRG